MGAEEGNPQPQPQPQPQQQPCIENENVEALLEAARYDDIDDLMSLASAGVPLDSKDAQGRTALHMAAANGHLDIVEYLIRNGADLNAYNVEKNTALHWACLNGHIEVVKTLIMAGADLTILNRVSDRLLGTAGVVGWDLQIHERCALDEAVSNGKVEVINSFREAVVQAELSGVRIS